MAEYRYLFYDLLTNQPITELPLVNVSFTEQLSSAGTFSGELLISDTNEALLSVGAGTIPGRTALYIERSDVANGIGRSLVWGGIIWGREYNSGTQSISLQGREFESFLEKALVNPNAITGTGGIYNTPVQFTYDSFNMVAALINAMQILNEQNIGIIVPSSTSGVTSTVYYTWTDMKSYYQALSDLAQGDTGFDFNLDVSYNAQGVPQKVLNLGYPRIGYVYSASDPNAPVLQLPGNIIDYSYFEDGSLIANRVWAIGAAPQSFDKRDNATAVGAGFPMLEGSASFPDISDANLVSALAQGRANALGYPPVTMKITQSAGVAPTVGVVSAGDDVRVKINDARFPTGLDTILRVSAVTVTPNESGGPETITYALTSPANFYN